jgi:hypothetical protein
MVTTARMLKNCSGSYKQNKHYAGNLAQKRDILHKKREINLILKLLKTKTIENLHEVDGTGLNEIILQTEGFQTVLCTLEFRIEIHIWKVFKMYLSMYINRSNSSYNGRFPNQNWADPIN